jgi:hypothetical protein
MVIRTSQLIYSNITMFIELMGGLTGKAQTYWLPTAESVAPTAISGNKESNVESKSSMNRWALQAWSSNGSSNALNVRSRAADPSNNGASGPRMAFIRGT